MICDDFVGSVTHERVNFTVSGRNSCINPSFSSDSKTCRVTRKHKHSASLTIMLVGSVLGFRTQPDCNSVTQKIPSNGLTLGA